MTRINAISPLSTRNLNQEPNRNEAGSNTIQYHQDDNVRYEEVKARFEAEFLPKYGSLWRRILRESESTENENQGNRDLGSLEPTLPNPRALNFLEAIERKQAVSISAAEECECPPAVVEFVELNEEQTKNITMDRKKRRSYKSRDIPSEDSIGFDALQNSDDETETEVEDDMQSVYETADEFELEDDDDGNKKPTTAVGNQSSTRATELKKSKTPIITIDSDSDEIEEGTSDVVNFRNDTCADTRIIDDDKKEGGKYQIQVPKLHILTNGSKKQETEADPIVSPEETDCLSPRLVEEGPSSTQEYDPLVDTDDEADDEYDSESEDEDEEEDEWVPDDESILSSPKSKTRPKETIEKRTGEKRTNSRKKSPKPNVKTTKVTEKIEPGQQMADQTIDLCDTSSSDDGFDSDFTVKTDYGEESKNQERIIATNLYNKRKEKTKVSFKRNREQITTSTFEEFNRKAFGGRLEKVAVQWSKKLNTTAGLTRLQKVSTDMTPGVPLKRLATIELSVKVVDDEETLRTTLLHELVHAAVWIIEGVSKPPHGADFKRWAKIAMSKVPDVKVTTTHSYQIQYKFNWACVNPKCSFTIGRHSRSVDLIRHRCGKCRGKLMEVTANGAPKKRAQPSAYNLFVKQHSKAVRERLAKRKPGVTQADVMKELGRLWREQKERSLTALADQ